MHPRNNPGLTLDNLRFLARQTAAQSHDLINVLNVINELTGLLSDALSSTEAGVAVAPARLTGLPNRIADQVGRGERIVRLINQFVHTAEADWAVVDLADSLPHAVSLVQRRARLCRSEVRLLRDVESCVLETNPLGLLHAVVGALELALEPLGREPACGGILMLEATPRGNDLEISVTLLDGASLGPLALSGIVDLRNFLANLGARLELRPRLASPERPADSLCPAALVLRFPRRQTLDRSE